MIRCRDVLVSYSLRPYLFEACWLIFLVHVCGYCVVLLPREYFNELSCESVECYILH